MKRLLLTLFFLLFVPILAFAQYFEQNTKLSPGDTIEIRFFFTPDLNKIQTIRPDGKIVLQLVGEITAAGKTPSELTKELYRHYSEYFKQLDIAVLVEYSHFLALTYSCTAKLIRWLIDLIFIRLLNSAIP